MKNKLQRYMRQMEQVHLEIILTLILLCTFGALMVYSASAYICLQSKTYKFDSMYLLKRQLLFMLMGFGIILIFQYVNYWVLELFARITYTMGLMIIFLLISPFAVSSHGARRWVRLVGFQFQPAEIVKVSVIIFLAYMISRYYRYLGSMKFTIYLWFAGGIPAVLLFRLSNDLSSSIVILGITFGVTFISTKTWKTHLVIAIAVLFFIALYVAYIATHLPGAVELDNMSFRVGRIAAWLKPEQYISNQGYQTLNALYAIGSGGWFGKGIGKSIQKLGAIPEAQNDMIFAIICEELGIVGAVTLIGLFGYLIYSMVKVIIRADTIFGAVLVEGVVIHIASQTILNIGVALNLFPNTGIALPFISYGGTSVLCTLFEMAIVVSVSRNHLVNRSRRLQREEAYET